MALTEKRRRTGRSIFARILLGIGLLPGTASADALHWTMPVAFSSALPALGTPAAYLADRLERMSEGQIELTLQEPGDGIAATGILRAVDAGRVAAGYTWTAFDRETAPSASLFAAVPFGLKPWAFMAWYYQGEGHEMLQDVYANGGFDVHAQLCGLAGAESAGWYRSRIDTAADFDGLEIRFGGLGGEVLRRLGATISTVPPAELLTPAGSGQVGATEFSLPVVDQYVGLDEFFSHNLYPGWHQPFTAQYLLVNGKRWRQASPAQRAMIETACTAATARSLAESEYSQGKAVATLEKEGVKVERLPQPVLDELRAVTKTVMEAHADRNPLFRRIYESQKAFQAEYGRWEALAY